MRPMLHPGLRRVWRSPDTVQFGVDVLDPVVLTGIDDDAAELMTLLDGSAEAHDVIAQAVSRGHDLDTTTSTLAALLRAGVVIDAGGWPGGRTLTEGARARLAPDLRARALPTKRSGIASSASEAVVYGERLATSAVRLHGLGRLGAALATMLTSSGVGRVEVCDDRPVDHADVCAAGHVPNSVGEPRTALLHQLLPWHVTTERKQPIVLDVVTDAVDARVVATELGREHRPHLIVSALEAIGRIGPMVLPGRSACLQCYDQARTDDDPAWPQIVLQHEASSRAAASDGTLVAATAAVAALHILDWLGGGRPPSVNGVVELARPHATMRHRRLLPHPNCGCNWSTQQVEETMVS